MTPSVPDRDVIRNKLRVIEESLDVLETLRAVDGDRLRADQIVKAAVERLLTRIVDQAVEINSHIASARLGHAPGEYRESFLLARDAGAVGADLCDQLMQSVGMRNVIIHGYEKLDLDRVAKAIPLALEQYRRYVSDVAAFVISLEEPPRSGQLV